jgi:hypothetical protein
MSKQNKLERRYQRWLSLYPPSFRAEHEGEVLDVLMQGASPGQVRPTPREVASLAAHGLRLRAGRHLPSDWERAHAKVMFPLRVVIALWLCFISAMLVTFGQGELWLTLLIPAIATHVYLAYRIRPRVEQPKPPTRIA